MNNISYISCELFSWARPKVNIHVHKSYLPPASKAHLHVIIRTKAQRIIVCNCSPLLSKGLLSRLCGILSELSGAFPVQQKRRHVVVSCNKPGGLYPCILML